MGQYDVLDFLEIKWKKGTMKYYSVKELKKHITGNTSQACTKLRRDNRIDFKEEKPNNNGLYKYYTYRWKP